MTKYKVIGGKTHKCYGVSTSQKKLEEHKKKLQDLGMEVHIRDGCIYGRKKSKWEL